jgi:hypothetical protein
MENSGQPRSGMPSSSIALFLMALLNPLFTSAVICTADDVPATQPGLNYKPGVDDVMTLLRDPAKREPAEEIIRGFPEPALPIVKDDLANQFSDLPPEVRAEVTRLVDRNHAGRAHARDAAHDDAVWNESSLKESYLQVGRRNPAWDADAIAAMLAFTQDKPDLDLFNKALTEGCRDPLFRYCHIRSLQMVNGGRYTKRLDAVAEAMMASNYPASRKCYALLHAAMADFPTSKSATALSTDQLLQTQKRLDSALALFPEVCKEPSIPPHFLGELAFRLQDGNFSLSGDRLIAFDKVYPVVAAALPQSPIPLHLKGRVYIDSAWDARGTGYANTVTPEADELMRKRLEIARAALIEASDKDSFDYVAPTAMLDVVLGEGTGETELKKWFIRAIEANPDDRLPYTARMYFL